MDPSIYYIQVLKGEFRKRRLQNQAYSLRSFSASLGVSAGLLSGLLNGKKGISNQVAIRMAFGLKLNREKSKLFLLSAAASHSRSEKNKKKAADNFTRMQRRTSEQVKLSERELSRIQTWYHFAILELCELPQCAHTADWFAAKLKIPVVVAEHALEDLVEAKQLEYRQEKYRPISREFVTSTDVVSPALRQFHSGVLYRAKESLMNDQVNEREFTSLTMAFHQADLEKAKAVIRELQADFADRFYRSSNKEKNSVFQISIQLFAVAKDY